MPSESSRCLPSLPSWRCQGVWKHRVPTQKRVVSNPWQHSILNMESDVKRYGCSFTIGDFIPLCLGLLLPGLCLIRRGHCWMAAELSCGSVARLPLRKHVEPLQPPPYEACREVRHCQISRVLHLLHCGSALFIDAAAGPSAVRWWQVSEQLRLHSRGGTHHGSEWREECCRGGGDGE